MRWRDGPQPRRAPPLHRIPTCISILYLDPGTINSFCHQRQKARCRCALVSQASAFCPLTSLDLSIASSLGAVAHWHTCTHAHLLADLGPTSTLPLSAVDSSPQTREAEPQEIPFTLILPLILRRTCFLPAPSIEVSSGLEAQCPCQGRRATFRYFNSRLTRGRFLRDHKTCPQNPAIGITTVTLCRPLLFSEGT